MEKHEKYGFGDLLLDVGAMLILLRWTGVLTCSWTAISHFNLFVLIYLVVVFIIDLVINVIIPKRDK